MTGKRWLMFKVATVLLVIVSIISAFAVSEVSEVKFWLLLGITALVSAIYLALFIVSQRNLRSLVSDMTKDLNLTERDALYKFPAPAVIIDDKGTIVWYNISFMNNVYSSEAFGINISKIIEVDLEKIKEGKEFVVMFQGKHFKVTTVGSENAEEFSGSKLSLIYLEDISSYVSLENEFNELRPTVMFIAIDSADEILAGEKESDKTQVLIQIAKIIESYIDNYHGVLKKISADKYFAVVEYKNLEGMVGEKFKLIEEVRKIPVSSKTPITISVGVGALGENLHEVELTAKQALEMAQGRGGDQVALKRNDNYEFFGGVTKGVEKRTKVKTRIVATALIELITSSSKVLIMGHRNADMDSVGSAVGMLGAIRQLNSEIDVTVVVDENRNLSKQLINRIKYNLPDEKTIFMDVETAIEQADENTLLIVVDTHNKDILESIELYEKISKIVVIDHHRQVVNHIDNAVLFHHEPYASSASEMVTEIVQYFPNIDGLQSYYADALLSGIMLDTKDFIMRTGVRTFEAAAFLRKLGADMVAVKGLFSNSFDEIKRRSEIISKAEIYNRCAIALNEDLDENGRVVSAQAADLMLSIEGVEASFVIFTIETGVSISARSRGALNVQIIMEKLGGGGHQTMAAAQFSDLSVSEARTRLVEAINEHIENIS